MGRAFGVTRLIEKETGEQPKNYGYTLKKIYEEAKEQDWDIEILLNHLRNELDIMELSRKWFRKVE